MLKKLVLMGVALLVILILTAIIVPYFIPDQAYKGPILRRIQMMTGHNVTVGGRFQIRLFPIAGVTMENVALTNPPRYGDTQPLATIKSIDIDVAVMPLLKGNVVVSKLIIDEPQLNLHVTKEGIKNWLPPRLAFPLQAAEGQPMISQPALSSPMPIFPFRNLLLGNVKLQDGLISYNDEAAKDEWKIKKINVGLSLNGLASPFTVDASGEWRDKLVTVKATLGTLQTFFNQTRTQIDADVESDFASLAMHGFMDKVLYAGNVEIKSSSLKALAAWIDPAAAPIRTPAPLALNLSSNVECSVSGCNLSNANLTLDTLRVKGIIRANHGSKMGQPPQIDANVIVGIIDFNQLFPAQHADAGGELFSDAYAETNGKWSDKPLDLSFLKAVNSTADITADGIVINKITLGKTTLRTRLENGKLNADVLDSVMYGGKGTATVSVDSSAPVPKVESYVTLKGIQVQPLLKDAADLSRLSGTADIAFLVSGSGKSEKDLVSSLTGNGQFKLTGGAIEGVDLVNIIANKPGSDMQKTPIEAMQGTFTVAQGLITNNDLVMTLPTLHVSGQGFINLPSYSIAYRLTPQTVQAVDKTGTAKEGVSVPVMIEGSLDKPSFRPDLNAVAQNALKNPQAFKEQLKNTRDTLKDALKNPDAVKNLKNMLQGF